jgi:hypothetical protein
VRRAAVLLLGALVLVPGALAATPAPPPTAPVYDSKGRIIRTPFVAPDVKPHLTEERATAIFLAQPKVRDWLKRYPTKDRVTDATYDNTYRDWTVGVWWGKAGEIATGRVDDQNALVKEAWTGPQVAWKMARGYDGAFGGKKINSLGVWLTFSAIFLLGLLDFRRPLSLRNLDLLALISFSVPLWFFNHGDIFTSVSLVYPGLVYLLGRAIWVGIRGRPTRQAPPLWPIWALAAAAVFLTGFRVGLNIRDSNVIDVGYAGVIGAHRILHGESPYNHFPVEEDLKPCGEKDREGEIRLRIQTNGRCESANPRGDTYGPMSYIAYIPGYAFLGWSGKWDDLPAVHFTSILWDIVCIFGLALVGRRFGGNRLAATLAFAWAAYPFTQYASMSNTNDSIQPAFLIWGFWLVTIPWARGAMAAFAGWTKFSALLVAPLWLSYPNAFRGWKSKLLFLGGFAAATLVSFSVLLLEPNPLHAARVFWDRTISWQYGRESPFSLWDWGQYHARGIPDLHLAQQVLEVLLLVGTIAAYFLPRRKSPLQLAALTGALLLGFELCLTHWFYLYIPWFFPFAAFVALAGTPALRRAPVPAPVPERPRRELAGVSEVVSG